MPDHNAQLKAAIVQVVNNQIRDGTPPETRQTFERLIESGYTSDEARRLIGCVVSNEIFKVLNSGKPYNEVRYLAALHHLPNIAWDT